MGQQFIISGYIECFTEKNEKNIDALKCFSYESETRFPNLFPQPGKGYQCYMVSFAGAFKNFGDDWSE